MIFNVIYPVFMKKLLLTIFVSGILYCQNAALAQSRFYRNNQLEIDRVKAVLSKGCRAYESVKPASGGQVKADKKLIGLLNEFYNNDLPVDAITKKLEPFLGRKWKLDTINLGGCMKYTIPVRSDGNIKATVYWTVFQNEVVYKRINFETNSGTKCVSPAQDQIDLVDINYLDLFCLPIIDFPISFCAGCGHVECEAVNYTKIKIDDASGYKLIPTDSISINHMVWFRDDTYQTERADSGFVTIANNHNTYLLFRLLYSPNQVAAIYSMEALTWLEKTGVTKMPDYVAQKMEEIRNSTIPIASQYGDVVKKGSTYKELAISTEKIMAKYGKQASLSSK